MTWDDFWNGAKELPFWAFSIRAVLLYIALIIATRFMRQRQIAIHTGHNYLVAAGIVSLAAVRMVNPESSLSAGLLIVILYAVINILQSYLDVKFPRFIDRHATILVQNGQIIKKNMLDSRITSDNLMGQLRVKNIFSLSEVELALVEPSGKINVIKKASELPVTRKQMNLPIKNVSVPTVLVYDGKVQIENLKMMGYDFEWLDAKLKEKGVMQIKDVFLALLESDGTVHISV
jgi:Predicted membrane protein